MTVTERLRQLLSGGKVANVKMKITTIEHDATRCDERCAICFAVEREITSILREMEIPDDA